MVFLGNFPGRDLIQSFGETNIAFIGRHLHAGVKEAIELRADSIAALPARAMADVQAADAAGEIDVAIAVHIFERGAFGLGDVDRDGVAKPARDGVVAARV